MKYIGFYAPLNISKYERAANLASQAKMDYIIELMCQLGNKVEIVSPSWITSRQKAYEKSIRLKTGEGKTLVLGPSFSSKNRILRGLAVAYSLLWLFFYLIKNAKRHETVVAYHVQWTAYPLILAKKIKKLNLILEVEEIYQQIWENKKFLNRMENRIIKHADSYILSTDLLSDSLPPKNSVTIYGNYAIKAQSDRDTDKDEITLVYAGIIDEVKGGATLAVRACEYLPEKYTLKIIGFGNAGQIEKLGKEIEKINKKTGRAAAEYCGVKRGEEYTEFMAGTDIGLNPQVVSEFDRVEFPSKVISYMSFGLNVVSTPLRCLTHSEISDIIEFSDDDSPQAFAKAVIALESKSHGSRIQKLNELHGDTMEKLRILLGGNR